MELQLLSDRYECRICDDRILWMAMSYDEWYTEVILFMYRHLTCGYFQNADNPHYQ